jgi:hypothetical protein
MKQVWASYRGWHLIIVPNWHGDQTTYFIVAPGPDPRFLWGERETHDLALIAARKVIIHEARNESSSRSDR